MLRIFVWLFFLDILLLTGSSLQSQDRLFVSVKGNDRNAGTEARPLRTLQAALDKAVNVRDKAVTVMLRQGTYYLDKTIVLEGATLLPFSLEIAGYPGEKVTISAGRHLTLSWKHYRNGIYVAEVPPGISFERLYVNGELQPMARYPNYDSSARVFNGTAADALDPERVKRWKDPVGGYIHALHAYEWGGFHYRITGVDEHGNLQMEGGWQNNRPNKMHSTHRFVENIFEELDAPGEWWLDSKRQLLYYYPRPGTDLRKAVVEVSKLKNSIELKGSESRPVKRVRLVNLHFAHNERSIMENREQLLRSDWTIYRGGAVLLDGTEHCTIADCVFEGIGGNAVMFSNYNYRDTVTGSHIYNTGGNAVCFIGDMKAVRSPSFRYEEYVPYEQLDKTPGPLTNNFPRACVVTDNLFHNLGILEKQATGVQIEVASEITVSHNSIYNTSRAGINIGDGCFGGHILEYNDVFNTVQETGDHGSFNSWGRDRFWAPDRNYMDSLVAVHPELILLDAIKTTVIRNNRFRCDHGWDIDLDDGSSNYHIYNNLCLNGGLKLREGFFRTVENNILVNNSFHPHVWFNNSGDVFERNIVMKKYAPILVKDWGQRVDRNLFPDSAALSAAQANGTDRHSVTGNPQFLDPAAGDFRVSDQSPALKTGFRNFPMDQFGVKKKSLQQIALKPAIPLLITDEGLADKSIPVAFLGGSVKSIDGLGDRSAYGLPDETGVVVLDAGTGSLLTVSGLQPRDVIRTADGKPVKDVRDIIDIYQSLNWTGRIPLTIMRNQQVMEIILKTK